MYVYIIYIPLKNAVCLTANDQRLRRGHQRLGPWWIPFSAAATAERWGGRRDSMGFCGIVYIYICIYVNIYIYNGLESHTYIYILSNIE